MGYDSRPASWNGEDRPKISARLSPCCRQCKPTAYVDTSGMWGASHCGQNFLGDDYLGFDTWRELVSAFNRADHYKTEQK